MGAKCTLDADCTTGSCTDPLVGSQVCECTSDAQCGKSGPQGSAYKCVTSIIAANTCQDQYGNTITPVAQFQKFYQIPIPLNQCTAVTKSPLVVVNAYTWVSGTPLTRQELDRLANGLGTGGWIGAGHFPLFACARAGVRVCTRVSTRKGGSRCQALTEGNARAFVRVHAVVSARGAQDSYLHRSVSSLPPQGSSWRFCSCACAHVRVFLSHKKHQRVAARSSLPSTPRSPPFKARSTGSDPSLQRQWNLLMRSSVHDRRDLVTSGR